MAETSWIYKLLKKEIVKVMQERNLDATGNIDDLRKRLDSVVRVEKPQKTTDSNEQTSTHPGETSTNKVNCSTQNVHVQIINSGPDITDLLQQVLVQLNNHDAPNSPQKQPPANDQQPPVHEPQNVEQQNAEAVHQNVAHEKSDTDIIEKV